MSQLQKLFNNQNILSLFQKSKVIHEQSNGVKIFEIGNRYTLYQFKEYNNDLKKKLNAINEFEKNSFEGINLAKVLFCYELGKSDFIMVVIDGSYRHHIGQVSQTALLRQTSMKNYNKTSYNLFYTNYLMMQQGYANIDLQTQYVIQRNQQIEYVYQPLLGLSKLPADLTDKQIEVNLSPEGLSNMVKDEKSLVYENLYVWSYYELERQGKDQQIEEIKLYAQKVKNEETMEDFRNNLKRAFTEIYEKNSDQPKVLCDIDDLFDKVIIYEPSQRLSYLQFLKCFKEVIDNYKEKTYDELI